MNYYDLSNPSTPPTRGYRLGLWRSEQRIYRILVVLAAILTYILLYLTLKRERLLRMIC